VFAVATGEGFTGFPRGEGFTGCPRELNATWIIKLKSICLPYPRAFNAVKEAKKAMSAFVKQHSAKIGGLIKQQVMDYDIPTNMDMSNICLTHTNTVNQKTIDEVEKRIGSKAHKLKIIPMLRERLCHNNVQDIRKISTEDTQHVIGYNITSCFCGEIYCLEIHSVLKIVETGELIDLTKDFAHEKTKWFIPVYEFERTDTTHKIMSVIRVLYKHFEGSLNVYSFKKTHKCINGANFAPNKKYPLTIEEAVKQIRSVIRGHPVTPMNVL